ncbi:DUF342 domain-containing protein [Spirochaeta dissipatitropha]
MFSLEFWLFIADTEGIMDAQPRKPHAGDAVFTVEVSDDGLQAFGTFRPAVGKGQDLSMDYIEAVLFQNSVSYNIRWLEIRQAVETCNTSKQAINRLLIAEGDKPEAVLPERLVVEARFRRRHPVPGAVQRDSGVIDLRERHLFIVVSEGDQVAHRVPARSGVEGRSVGGEAIPAPEPHVPLPVCGMNLEENDGKVTALVGGQLIFDDKKIEVLETLQLAAGIGYHTGHIRFPGNIELAGQVKPGFKIWVGGDLHSKDTLDVTEVYAEGRVICDAGIMGHGSGLLRSKAGVRARFVENGVVESHKAIYVQQSCLHGKLRTLDRVVFGDKARVVGSEIVAGNGVFVHSLGSPRGGKVTVWAGINFITERKIENIRQQVERIVSRIAKLRMYREQHPNEKIDRRMRELEEKRNEMQQQIGDLLVHLDANEQAIVAVRDSVYPGTVIYICRSYYVVKETLKSVQFSLDATSGKITYSKFERSVYPRLQELETGEDDQ